MNTNYNFCGFEDIKVGFYENQSAAGFNIVRYAESNLTNLDISIIKHDYNIYALFDKGDASGTLLFVDIYQFKKGDVEYRYKACKQIIESFDFLERGLKGYKQIAELMGILS